MVAASVGAFATPLGACTSFSEDVTPNSDAAGGDAKATPDAQQEGDGGKSSAYREAVMADGPLAYWRMGVTTGLTVPDETSHLNDFILQGPKDAYALGVEGAIAGDGDTAIRFDGIAGNARATNPRAFDFAGKAPFTIELWAKRETLDHGFHYQHMLTESQGSTGNRTGFDLYVLPEPSAGEKEQTSFQYNALGAESAGFAPLVAPGRWAHYVAAFDGTNITLYVDGTADTARPISGPLTLTTAQLIVGGAEGDNYFPGAIDEVAIYDKALTNTRIALHRSLGRP